MIRFICRPEEYKGVITGYGLAVSIGPKVEALYFEGKPTNSEKLFIYIKLLLMVAFK